MDRARLSWKLHFISINRWLTTLTLLDNYLKRLSIVHDFSMNLFSFRGYNKKWKIEFFTSRMPKSLSFKWQLIVYSIVYDNIVPLNERGKSRSQSVMIHEYQYKLYRKTDSDYVCFKDYFSINEKNINSEFICQEKGQRNIRCIEKNK